MRTPHLVAAAAAVLLCTAALAAAAASMQRLEAGEVHALAAQMFAEKHRGVALQRAAFRAPDLLPIYGSSELNVRNRYHASAVFREYPTGFTVFPVGNVGSTSLIWLQALAAVGSDLRGKKVAVSLPTRSFLTEGTDPQAYAANFSPLHAGELAFSSQLSFAVKQAAARRMLEYPATVHDDPLLRFALERLADGSPLSRVLYYASLPLGRLHNAARRLQDHWRTLVFLRAQLGLAPGPRRGSDLDWPALLRQAEDETRRSSDSNAFGFDNAFWATHAPDIARQKAMYPPEVALRAVERSAEWTDADLLLRVIGDLGGEPLLLVTPPNESYADYVGVDATARRVYLGRLRELADRHHVPLVDFAARTSDASFTVDPALHLSGLGWAYYDRALDSFFHGRAPDTM